jgi:hypothetical protein
MDQVLMGLIGVLVGAIIGAAGSYWGAERGAKTAYELTEKSNKEQSRLLFITLLRFSYLRFFHLDNFLEVDPRNYRPNIAKINLIVYDKNWYSYLPYLDELEQEEIEAIIGWFALLEEFDRSAERGAPFYSIEDLKKSISEFVGPIRLILDKLTKEP